MKNFFGIVPVILSFLFSINLKAQTWAPFPGAPTNNVLWDVFALNANNAWAVGNVGTVLYWNGSSWASQNLGVTSQRFGVWASAANNVYVVGITTGSQIHRYNGTTWTNISTATGWGSGSVRSVWGSSANDVWITGGSGRVFRFNGTNWQAANTNIPATFSGSRIWGTDANNIWLVGSTGGDNTGVIYKWNTGTSSWVVQASGIPVVKGIWGSSATDMWAAGGNGASQQGKIFRLSGSTWSDVSPAGSYASFYHIYGMNASNIWAAGYNGVMYKYNGTSWSAHSSGVATDINAVAAGTTGTGTRLWTTGYGDGTVNPLRFAIDGVLPLSWNSITVHASGSNALLQWSTLAEYNTRHFEIEYHNGNNQWAVIGTTAAAGYSNSLRHYSYTHPVTSGGDHFYRIKQIDTDGAGSYSKTVHLQAGNSPAKLLLLNNPVRNRLLQLYSASIQEVTIYDMQGRKMQQQKLVAGNNTVDINSLPAGTYILAAGKDTQHFLVP